MKEDFQQGRLFADMGEKVISEKSAKVSPEGARCLELSSQL